MILCFGPKNGVCEEVGWRLELYTVQQVNLDRSQDKTQGTIVLSLGMGKVLSGQSIQGFVAFRVVQKQKWLMGHLYNWNELSFRHLRKKLEDAQLDLEDIQKSLRDVGAREWHAVVCVPDGGMKVPGPDGSLQGSIRRIGTVWAVKLLKWSWRSFIRNAYDPSRLITDNILLVHETIEFIQKKCKGQSCFALKLDMSKAVVLKSIIGEVNAVARLLVDEAWVKKSWEGAVAWCSVGDGEVVWNEGRREVFASSALMAETLAV
ncbi:hypothetical protein RHSIM_Rhsim03G0016600 [Rhododendron simsii]|uniref:Uncharacterized protein n=1 Tax=Rhododendron simsii TaxID=118357 RepID=A0A834HCR6_RHOSS|nr:hypothetical protein RHSIM_Rhsim03G0016600 [Rhododendron simsii]